MLVLLDRDGVINEDRPDGVHSVGEFIFLPRAIEAIYCLNKARIPLAVVTNQALVGRGEINLEELEIIHGNMEKELRKHGAWIDRILVCTDTDAAPGFRRKPAPGMLLEAMYYFGEVPSRTFMVGDASRDMEAAERAGCNKILVRTGKGAKTESENPKALGQTVIVDDLWDAVEFLLHQNANPGKHV